MSTPTIVTITDLDEAKEIYRHKDMARRSMTTARS